MEVVRDTPLERVLHRTPEPIVDVPVPHIKEDGLLIIPQERAVYTGQVFTVKLRHHRDDQACSDNVEFIKGLDKHNMPRLGDVMVSPSPDHRGHRRPCGASGFLVQSEITGCCG